LDPTTPSGWSEIRYSPLLTTNSAGISTRLSVFWKRATSSSEGDAVIPNIGSHGNAVIMTYKNCVTTGEPFDLITTTSKNTLNNSTSINSGVPNHSCNDVLFVAARAGDNGNTAQYSGEADSSLTSLVEKVDGA